MGRAKSLLDNMAKAKRKSASSSATETAKEPPSFAEAFPPPPQRRSSQRAKAAVLVPVMNPDLDKRILDGPGALRASPDASEPEESFDIEKAGVCVKKQVREEDDSVPSLVAGDSESSLSELSDLEPAEEKASSKKANGTKATVTPKKVAEVTKAKAQQSQFLDPEADGEEEADEEEIQAALSRPPPVNSDYLPLPWKGRLGYACLNTYLRFSNPPVFASRTCRIASILENRHPLKDPSQPPHATKNRPDRDQPADIGRGQAYVESLGLANASDVIKMLRWNDRYGIKFMRLSSEMFPFASHEEYGYKLAPFASEVLSAVGKVAAKLGHRVTTHPGQFTQLGSPRKQVIDNAIRDLEYHAEMLSLLKMPPQQNRDAVMILHLGGVFGDKVATLDRFRENYAQLSQGIKDRLVLENDDVSWSVHDLLPICEELNIPMVLDFHHNNIIFDADKIREGNMDIMELYPRILATWKRKNVTPKMHYSEPTPSAITGRQRRKHNPRVATLPPCPPDMDLMIEAKDKEQAVFELMRTFKLPGFDTFNDIIPHVRKDDNKPIKLPKKKTPRKKAKKTDEEKQAEEVVEEEDLVQQIIEKDEVGMGGLEGRVYWPPGMEDWLRPVKRVVKKKEYSDVKLTPAQKRKLAAEDKNIPVKTEDVQPNGVSDVPTSASIKSKPVAKAKTQKATPKKQAKSVPTPITSDDEALEPLPDLSEAESYMPQTKQTPVRQSGRAKRVKYTEPEE